MKNLLIAGSVFMFLSLALAWLLVATKYMGMFTSVFKNIKFILSAHLDYIFMAILNWLLYVLFLNLGIVPPALLVWLVIAGSAINPLLFVYMAVNPGVNKSPLSPFGAFSAFSFTLATAGYGWSALITSEKAM